MLKGSKFNNHINVTAAIDALRTQDHSDQWYKFLTQQMIQDNYIILRKPIRYLKIMIRH
jgi:hypothetical protein